MAALIFLGLLFHHGVPAPTPAAWVEALFRWEGAVIGCLAAAANAAMVLWRVHTFNRPETPHA